MLDGIGDAEHSGGLAVNPDEHRSLALPAKVFGKSGQRAGIDFFALEENRVAEDDSVILHAADDAFARHRTKILHLGKLKVFLPRPVHNGCRERVFARQLKACSEAEQVRLLPSWKPLNGLQ